MKRTLNVLPLLLCLGFLAALGLSGCTTAAPDLKAGAAPDAFEQNKMLGRGVNIIGYDPLWRSQGNARFQAKHFRVIKEGGFQSVRVNLHPFRHMDPQNGWALRPAFLETVDWAVTNATAQGLRVILDMHEYNQMGKEPEKMKEPFLAFWRQLSDHFQNSPDSVLFEILNEPNDKLTPELWNQYLKEVLAVIREKNPTRDVIVGPASWNSVDSLKLLQLPADDRHLIVTVHYYKPMEFTHQGASWTGQKDKLGVSWGSEADKKAVQADFDKVNEWANANHRPIFLGEFGAYDKGPIDSRVAYTSHVARTAEAAGWSWAYWQFDSDFILWDMAKDSWVEPIHKALVP